MRRLMLLALALILCPAGALAQTGKLSTIGQNVIIPCSMIRAFATPEFMARAEAETRRGATNTPTLVAIHDQFRRLADTCAAKK